ncbi:MAG TPA: ATP-binding protein [Candidatus Saccharimonadales bacterium]|nr:ATP-binding protein [Candidatus Saccharimonadales bacterium]
MNDSKPLCILTLRLRHERHVVHARQRARDIAAMLGFEHQDQIRLATAASELARNAYRYATNGVVEFLIVKSAPQIFVVSVTDSGPGIPDLESVLDGRFVSKTGMGKGITGTKRLMDYFKISSSTNGTRVEVGKALPSTRPPLDEEGVKRVALKLAKSGATDPFDEVERQNQELLKTLAELREKQEQLAELNCELEDTNRGVVALYAELDQHADDLRRVSDLKTSFLSNLSHEFRTPLNSITSLSRMLIGHTDGDLTAEQEKQVKFIERSAEELTELVNDLLDLAKVEAGKIDVKPRHFEVSDLFGVLRGMLKPLLASNSLELIFEASPELSPLYTDEGKVSQILRNLISNALKFTRKGQVRVTAQPAGDQVVFRVEDTGIGIAPEDQERIFEEFVQVDSELQSGLKGTGLGLPLSRRLAELLGGTIQVESVAGVGSKFTVTLPVFVEKPKGMRTAPAPQQGKLGRTVLFVEDNEETNFVHQASLRNSQYKLIFVSNIPDARAAMRRCAPAAVVLDRFLEGQDSLFFIEEMRSGYSGPTIVTSVVDDPKAAIEAGADAFLAKPVSPVLLANTLRELIEGRSSKSALLVDDDEVTRYLLGENLGKLGYHILEAHNGREAIRLASLHIPTIMFLDVVMPDLTGFEVLRELRNNTATRAIPIIVHTSKELTAEEIAYLEEMEAVPFPKKTFGGDGCEDQLQSALAAAGIEP